MSKYFIPAAAALLRSDATKRDIISTPATRFSPPTQFVHTQAATKTACETRIYFMAETSTSETKRARLERERAVRADAPLEHLGELERQVVADLAVAAALVLYLRAGHAVEPTHWAQRRPKFHDIEPTSAYSVDGSEATTHRVQRRRQRGNNSKTSDAATAR